MFGAAVVAQSVIVVTGGLVRVTASGLGCPTWPRCFEGSYVPVGGQPQSFHKLIEFGNRSLTFVLVLVVVAASSSRGGGSPAAGRSCCCPRSGCSASPPRR